MASKILFYRLKHKFLIINFIYMLHRMFLGCFAGSLGTNAVVAT